MRTTKTFFWTDSLMLFAIRFLFVAAFLLLASGFSILPHRISARSTSGTAVKMSDMIEITPGVQFHTIAREWRLKWSEDADKKSLQSVQQTLTIFENELKSIPGMKSVQRIVCGGCLDFKVIVALDAAEFGNWEGKKFAPEESFLNAVKAIEGVSQIETQTFTIMPV